MEPVWRLFPSPVRRHSRQDASKRPRTGFCNGFYTFGNSQNDPQTILKRSSNDPQMPAYWFLQGIVQVLTCSKRSSTAPQTILKRSSNANALVFAMDSTRFEVLRTILKRSSDDPQTLLKRWRTGFCNGSYKF